MAEKFDDYVFDTSCFIEDPHILTKYEKDSCYIPLPVLEELDNLKTRLDHVGAAARTAINYLDSSEHMYIFPKKGDHDKQDNAIISSLVFFEEEKNRKPILVTNDINLKVKAVAYGFLSEKPNGGISKGSEKRYKGIRRIEVADEAIDKFYKGDDVYLGEYDLVMNEYLIMTSSSNPKKSALGRYRGPHRSVKKLRTAEKDFQLFSLKPRNMEQIFAADALIDPEIKVVSLVGIAGSGKTLMACAAGVQQVFGKSGSDKLYRKMIVSRPIQAMGGDIGFLPGTLEEKMEPWIQPIVDNLDYISKGRPEMVEGWFEKGKIEVEALTYIRGRSLPDVYIIIDESQNLTSHEVKTILTRVGENSKIILTGDVEQIDNFKLNEFSNGLSHLVERFKGYSLSAHVQLEKGERSEVAEIAAKIL